MPTFEITAKSASLAPFRKKLGALLETAGFDAKATHDVLLSVDEILTNIIRHAYGNQGAKSENSKIHVSFSDLKDKVQIQIEDKGPCFDPRNVPEPELPREKPGGLGIHLVRCLIDEINYEPLKPRGNRLRLVKYKRGEKGICCDEDKRKRK